jgi:hypothetical protein
MLLLLFWSLLFLTWTCHLLQDRFLLITIYITQTVGRLPLTTALTASQELAKEIQRQDLSQRIPFKNK